MQKEPNLLNSNTLNQEDLGSFQWKSSHNNDYLVVSNNSQTIEWKPPGVLKRIFNRKHNPCWIPASTDSQLHSGHFSWDFIIEEMANAQIGIGFLLQWDIGPDWGVFGYLGSSTTAWSYDPSTGDIVYATESICGGLPKFEDGHTGTVSIDLNIPRGSKGTGKFIVNGIDSPSIELPENSVVLPAACFLKVTQKITLANFKKL